MHVSAIHRMHCTCTCALHWWVGRVLMAGTKVLFNIPILALKATAPTCWWICLLLGLPDQANWNIFP